MDDEGAGERQQDWPEKDWHEQAPRIIASGRWEQDEYGDTTYIPDHIRPSIAERVEASPAGHEDVARGHYDEDPAPRDGYRVRSEAVWAAARRDYLAGDAAEAVCHRYDLKLGTLRSRAAREGWRRCDAEDSGVWPAPWPDQDDPVEEGAAEVPDLVQMAAQALMRLNRAVRRGRAAEAASWLRTWQALSSVNATPRAPQPSAQPDSPPPAPATDPLDTLEADMKAVAAIARDAARLSPDDHAGRRAIEDRIAALNTPTAPEL